MAPRSWSQSSRGIEHAAHAHRLDMQRHVQVLGRHGEQILRQALARVGVEVAAHDAADIGELIGGQPRAAAEHHVFLRVRRAGKAGRRLVRADQVVHRGRDHRRQRIAHDDDAQTIGQRRAQNPGILGRQLDLPACGGIGAGPAAALESQVLANDSSKGKTPRSIHGRIRRSRFISCIQPSRISYTLSDPRMRAKCRARGSAAAQGRETRPDRPAADSF